MPKKNSNLELLRIIGCLFIMILHFSERIPDSTPQAITKLIARFGVPLFFLIGGANLYGSEKSGLRIAIIRFSRIFFPLLFFVALYFFQEKAESFIDFFKVGYWHLWYLYTILPVYFLASVLRPPQHFATQKQVIEFVAVAFLGTFFFSTITFAPFDFIAKGSFHDTYGFAVAISMMVLGYGLSRLELQTKTGWWLLGGFLLVTVSYVLTGWLTEDVPWQFTSLPLLLESAFLFCGIKNLELPRTLEKPILLISKYMFHMYGWHVFWLLYLGAGFRGAHPFLAFGATVLLSFGSSIVSTTFFAHLGRYATALLDIMSPSAQPMKSKPPPAPGLPSPRPARSRK